MTTATVAAGSAVSLTTNTAKTITSISLSPGEYDVSGVIDFLPAATTSITNLTSSISLTTDSVSGQTGGSGLGTDPTIVVNQAANVPAALVAQPVPSVRLVLTATTTVYLVAKATFTVSTMTAYGTIRANRVGAAAT